MIIPDSLNAQLELFLNATTSAASEDASLLEQSYIRYAITSCTILLMIKQYIKQRRIARHNQQLLNAIEHSDDPHDVIAILHQGANADSTHALHYAAGLGRTEITKLLLDKVTTVDAPNKNGNTPLHYAAQHGHTEITRLLLDARATVDAKNKQNDTPLHNAVQNSHHAIIKMLLFEGADLTCKNRLYETPADLARNEATDETLLKAEETLKTLHICDNLSPMLVDINCFPGPLTNLIKEYLLPDGKDDDGEDDAETQILLQDRGYGFVIQRDDEKSTE
jgi:ankyrin repeat protein